MKTIFTKISFLLIAVFAVGILLHPRQAAAVIAPVAGPEAGEYGSGIRVELSSSEPAAHGIKYTL